MDDESKKPDYYKAFGQTIAALPELRRLKSKAKRRLERGEPEESVLSWLVETTKSLTTEEERAAAAHVWLARWTLEWAKTGEPGPIFKEARGSVFTELRPDGEGGKVKYVIAVAGRTSDPLEIAEEFVERWSEEFPDLKRAKKETPERDARWFRLSREGMLDWEIDAASPKEASWWGGANTVRQARFRWKKFITRITRSK